MLLVRGSLRMVLVPACLVLLTASLPQAEAYPLLSRAEPAGQPSAAADESVTGKTASTLAVAARVEGAVIRPYRQAAVAAEVQGVIEKRHYKEGDFVRAGAIVFEISGELIEMTVNRARERLAALEAAYQQSAEELKLREQLISHDAATLQEIVRARSEAKISAHRAGEAKIDLDLALRDARNCKVKSPFSGYIVSYSRDAYEPVQRFEQLFLIADTSKVYAVANMPQSMIRQIRRGSKATFTAASGGTGEGVVDKIEAPIDPSSQTKKVYILIDNSEGKLEMGMVGQVTFSGAER